MCIVYVILKHPQDQFDTMVRRCLRCSAFWQIAHRRSARVPPSTCRQNHRLSCLLIAFAASWNARAPPPLISVRHGTSPLAKCTSRSMERQPQMMLARLRATNPLLLVPIPARVSALHPTSLASPSLPRAAITRTKRVSPSRSR